MSCTIARFPAPHFHMSNVFLETDDRRQNGRVTPTQRIRGMVGNVPIYVLDLSLAGVRVAHQDQLPAIGQTATLVFEWEGRRFTGKARSEEHTSELQSQSNLVCRLLLEKKKK